MTGGVLSAQCFLLIHVGDAKRISLSTRPCLEKWPCFSFHNFETGPAYQVSENLVAECILHHFFFFTRCFPQFDPDNCFLHASRFSCPVTQHANSSFDRMTTAPPKASFKARCFAAQFVFLQGMPETFMHPVCLPTLQVALCVHFGSYFFTFLAFIYIYILREC